MGAAPRELSGLKAIELQSFEASVVMAQATDANISKLQQMFPKVEGDVIAILLNDCGNNGKYRVSTSALSGSWSET